MGIIRLESSMAWNEQRGRKPRRKVFFFSWFAHLTQDSGINSKEPFEVVTHLSFVIVVFIIIVSIIIIIITMIMIIIIIIIIIIIFPRRGLIYLKPIKEGRGWIETGSLFQSINQLHLNTVNGSASWFLDMPCDNYKL